MERAVRYGLATSIVVALATMIYAQTSQGPCPSCGGSEYQNPNCCVCTWCSGEAVRCNRCGDGEEHDYCKWVGTTCCQYTMKPYKYERATGAGAVSMTVTRKHFIVSPPIAWRRDRES